MKEGNGKTRAKRQRMHLGAGEVLQVGDVLAENSFLEEMQGQAKQALAGDPDAEDIPEEVVRTAHA